MGLKSFYCFDLIKPLFPNKNMATLILSTIIIHIQIIKYSPNYLEKFQTQSKRRKHENKTQPTRTTILISSICVSVHMYVCLYKCLYVCRNVYAYLE